MSEAKDLDDFLQAAGWGEATVTPLSADFSTRRFARLMRETEPRRAILMQATQEQKTPQFIAISGLLRRCGLSAPEVYASADIPARARIRPSVCALLEDLGDVTFGQLMDQGRDHLPLYRCAVDVLAKLHRTFDASWLIETDLPVFTAATFVEQAGLFLDFYVPHVRKREANADERAAFQEAWLEALKPLDALPKSLILRDYMPDNLMDVAGREGLMATGLLDFQDGGLGPIAYDLASLCECVRRDVSLQVLDEMTAYYYAQNPLIPLEDLRRACRVLAAQRHMRVLGIVTRLAVQGRPEKLAFLPRLEGYLGALFNDKALIPIKKIFDTLMLA